MVPASASPSDASKDPPWRPRIRKTVDHWNPHFKSKTKQAKASESKEESIEHHATFYHRDSCWGAGGKSTGKSSGNSGNSLSCASSTCETWRLHLLRWRAIVCLHWAEKFPHGSWTCMYILMLCPGFYLQTIAKKTEPRRTSDPSKNNIWMFV